MTLVSGGEASLSERFGVSRTVVRGSLRQLESERLITVLPNRGPIVTVLPRHDIESLYEVRRGLGGWTANFSPGGRATGWPSPTPRRPLDPVNRRFVADRPDELWLADITYVRTWRVVGADRLLIIAAVGSCREAADWSEASKSAERPHGCCTAVSGRSTRGR